MNRRVRTLVTGVVAVVAIPTLLFGGTSAWAADPVSPPTLPDAVTDDGATAPPPRGVVRGLDGATGIIEVSVRLAEPAIAEAVPEGALAEGKVPGKPAQRAKKDKVVAQQDRFVTA